MKNGKYCNGKKSLNMKPLAILLALTLLVGCAIGGTIAWLTAETKAVENTFTVGDITIKLSESTGNTFKIVPGATDAKDPTLAVKEGSEKCYVYALVENNLVLNNGTCVATLDVNENQWTSIATSGNKTLYRYYKEVTPMADDGDNSVDYTILEPVFESVTYDGAKITKENIGELDGKKIIVNGFAHQSENIGEGTTLADAAAKAQFNLT